MQLQVPTKIEIKESPGKGLGVFAIDFISKNEIIEECHLLTLPFLNGKGQPVLPDYRFNWPKKEAVEYVLPLGYGGCYNHSDDYNTDWREHSKYKAFQFYAIKDIQQGEELLVYYGGENYWSNQTKKVKLI